MTQIVNDPSKDFVTISGFTSEEFLQSVVDYASDGYTIVTGTAFLFGASKQVDMYKPKGNKKTVAEAIVVPEVVTPDLETAITSFNGDKNKLEEYGKTLGIDLKKNKKFGNMVKDLKDYLESPVE